MSAANFFEGFVSHCAVCNNLTIFKTTPGRCNKKTDGNGK